MAERSQAIAASSWSADGWSFDPEAEKNRQKAPTRPVPIAEVATVAAQKAEPLPWDDRLAGFIALPCPADVDAEKWDELQGEAEIISRRWGHAALAAGWSEIDIFGCDRKPFSRRLDRHGLVISIVKFAVPLRIIDITPAAAILQGPRDEILRHYIRPREGRILLWDAYPTESGP